MCFLETMCFKRIKATLVSVRKKSKKQACVLTARCAALKAPVDGAVSRGKMGKAAFPAQGHRAPDPSTASPQRSERTHLLVSYAWCTHTKPGLCVFALTSCCFAPGSQSEAELTTELHPPPALLNSLLLHLVICVWVCTCAHICAVAPLWRSECNFWEWPLSFQP